MLSVGQYYLCEHQDFKIVIKILIVRKEGTCKYHSKYIKNFDEPSDFEDIGSIDQPEATKLVEDKYWLPLSYLEGIKYFE